MSAFPNKWKSLFIISICLFSIYFAIPTFLQSNNSTFFKRMLPDEKVNLGLDLKGGVSLTIETDVNSYIKEKFTGYAASLQSELGLQGIKFNSWQEKEASVVFKLSDKEDFKKVKKIITGIYSNFADISNKDNLIKIEVTTKQIDDMSRDIVKQSMGIIRKRIDETGVREIDLQSLGNNLILLQVPGADSPDAIKRILGKTARLTFHLVEGQYNRKEHNFKNFSIHNTILPFEAKSEGEKTSYLIVKTQPSITGDMLIDASVNTGKIGEPVIGFKLNDMGGKIFGDVTSQNIGKMLAIVLDGKIISAPHIRDSILGGSGVISGNFTIDSASELALMLRAGALPVPLKIVEERLVGPTLGMDSIKMGARAAIIGAALIIVFMFVFYGFFGMVANVALIINLFMIIAVLTLLHGTLTLPGIAGIVLTLGMAVDANVLVFERIREEVRNGRSPFSAILTGYRVAFGTIFDSNTTTIAAAFILSIFGSGPIRGFAVTLIIGILCSMFTALTLTKMIIGFWFKIKKPSKLFI